MSIHTNISCEFSIWYKCPTSSFKKEINDTVDNCHTCASYSRFGNSTSECSYITNISQPAKSLKGNTGGGSFCSIGIQYAMPFSRKYTPPHCFFCTFAGWVRTICSSYKIGIACGKNDIVRVLLVSTKNHEIF